jgi:hypothetical protein
MPNADHILEYENHAGFDRTWAKILNSEVCASAGVVLVRCLTLVEQHTQVFNSLRPFLQSRSTQLTQEFAFLPTSPPHSEGGIFEMRSYQLNPGALLEWEMAWYPRAYFDLGR